MSDSTAAAERVIQRLGEELVGWFGPYAAHSLFTRARAHVVLEHPVLAVMHVGLPHLPEFRGLKDIARVHGAEAADAGAEAILAALIELLSRLINDELAMVLVEQSMVNRSTDRSTPGRDARGLRSAADLDAADGIPTADGTNRRMRND